MSRLQAAGIHLLISVLIVITVLALMLGVWYPEAYFKLMGGGGLLFIMAGVDVSLGPLLTLIIFKSGKKGLKFDLTVIALLQILALSYGSYVMFDARPVFTVFTADQFLVATPADISAKELARASKPEWSRFSLTGPEVVFAVRPTDQKVSNEMIDAALAGMDWHQFPRLYDTYSLHSADMLKRAKSMAELRTYDKRNTPVIDDFLKAQKRPETDFVFVPIRTEHAEMAVILDAKSADIIKILDVAPWK